MYCFKILVLCQITVCLADVVEITESTIHKQTTQNVHVLIFFYKTYCPLCHKLHKHFAKADENLARDKFPVLLGNMDCSKGGKSFCAKHAIDQVPVIHYYRNGSFVKEYTGGHNQVCLYNFVRAQVIPFSVELKTVDALKKFLKTIPDIAIVGFFERESRLKRLFFKFHREKKEEFIFAHSYSEKVLRKQGVFNGIVMFKPEFMHNTQELDSILFTGHAVIGEIKNFIYKHYHGLVGNRNPANVHDFSNPLVVLYYDEDAKRNTSELDYWKARIIDVARKYQSSAHFALSAKDEFESELAELGFSTNDTTPLIIATDLENQMYTMKDQFSGKNFDSFIEEFLAQNLTHHKKSKPVHFQRGVRMQSLEILAVNFYEEVMMNDKDILIYLHTPWCKKCREFLLEYDKLFLELRNDDIDVLHMDAGASNVPKFFIQQFPNIFLILKEDKTKPLLYTGPWKKEELKKYVETILKQKISKKFIHDEL